jgi:hypothetical protein
MGIALLVFLLARIAQGLWICFDEQSALPGVAQGNDWKEAKKQILMTIAISSAVIIPLNIYFIVIVRRWATQYEDSYFDMNSNAKINLKDSMHLNKMIM